LIDKGVSHRTTAVQFGVAKSTIGNINKNRDAIMQSWEQNCSNERKRKLRKTDNEAVNLITLQFFQKCHAMDIPITGPMLQTKAKEIAQRLHVENFQPSNGWLESFKTRHNIYFRFLSGESAAVDMEAVEDWKSKLQQVINSVQTKQDYFIDIFPGKD
jgi:hypothetical protein